jgi:hypothetical protein
MLARYACGIPKEGLEEAGYDDDKEEKEYR